MIREETRIFRKSRILETATRLFFELGYEATTVETLAKKLGVTKPFIYSYFSNKQEILEDVYRQSAERIAYYIDTGKGRKSPEQALADFIRLAVNENIVFQVISGVYLQEEKHLSPTMLHTVRNVERSIKAKLRQLIQEGIDRGVFAIADAGIATMAIIGMVRWVHRWYDREGRHSPEIVANSLAELGLNLVKYQNPQLRTALPLDCVEGESGWSSKC